MLKVKVEKGDTLDRVLKQLKTKIHRTGLMKEIRARQEFIKPSVKKRKQKLKTIYNTKKANEN